MPMNVALYPKEVIENHIHRLGAASAEPCRDPDVMTEADAGGMRTAVLRTLAAVAVWLGLVTGCTGAPTSGPTRPAQGAVGLRDVRPCPGIAGFSCGSLSVRLDPSGSMPGRLSLRVAVSDVASAPRGVLVFLTGGPGEPGVPFVSRLAGRLGPALRGYRLVMFDQRGTGAGALDCPALQRQMGASDLTVPSPAAARSCAAAIGPDRRFYAIADTVADIEALRVALGVARLTVDGVSYGSYVAERFALAHPGEVSRLVLDSVVPSWNVDPMQLVNMRQRAGHPARCPARGAGPGGCPADAGPGLAVRPGHGGGQRLHPDLPVLARRPGAVPGRTARRTAPDSRPAAGRRP